MTIKVRKVLTFEGRKKIGTGEEHMGASGVPAMVGLLTWFMVTLVTLIKHIFRFYHFSTCVVFHYSLNS